MIAVKKYGGPIIALYRLGLGGLVLVALVASHVTRWPTLSFNAVELVSFFSNLSNLYAAGLFLYLGLRQPKAMTPPMDMLRGAAVVFLLITGIGYYALLAQSPTDLITSPLGTLLHLVMPIAVVADWLVDPPGTPMALRRTVWWLSVPLIYIVAAEVRGTRVNWYPYWFLDPRYAHGLTGVLVFSTSILAGAAVLTIVVTWLGNARLTARDWDGAQNSGIGV